MSSRRFLKYVFMLSLMSFMLKRTAKIYCKKVKLRLVGFAILKECAQIFAY